MPEIKHNFTAGRMNKDLDERLVPNGQYRDALNIQVRTTDGDGTGIGDAGTVQNIQGHDLVSSAYLIEYDDVKSKVVGSIADEKSNNVYFYTAAPIPNGGIENIPPAEITNETIWLDSITEFNSSTNESNPVLVDVFGVTTTLIDVQQDIQLPNSFFSNTFRVADINKYRIGMKMFFYTNPQLAAPVQLLQSEDGSPGLTIIGIQEEDPDSDDNSGELILDSPSIFFSSLWYNANVTSDESAIVFVHPERVLEFDHNRLISNINIIDELLFWTDGVNEPKKININRSKAGSVNNTTHTKLFVNNPIIDDFVAVTGELNSPENELTVGPADIKKEHITVIRKKPLMAPEVEMLSSDRELETSFQLENFAFISDTDNDGIDNVPSANINNPSVIQVPISFWPDTVDFRINDVFTFKDNSNPLNPVIIRASISDITSQNVELTMLFVDLDLTSNNLNWQVSLEQKGKNLFESKFGRFAYRYKYEDNEYSAFSPWSELVFAPSEFSYTPSKGYNDGMLNKLKQVKIRNFIPHDSYRPSDVKEVDILWKTTDDANVYIVKSIAREINSEWENFTNVINETTGVLIVTSEMINRALPSNQILRGWDNVPKKAIAQEITANRIVYGNYEQGYDITEPIGLKQILDTSSPYITGKPNKSVKSLRQYRFGMVFGDKYGRETPVIANGYNNTQGETITGDVTVGKELAHKINKFKVQQNWEDIGATPLEWMDYVKYYVKETSNEYYNLTMDRWYEAKDGNVWLSFPSVDRNKVDEDTYIILKNEQGSQTPVSELARYKIIAIENEAPDFIKQSKYSFSKIKIGHDETISNVYTGDVGTAIPDKLIGTTKIESEFIDPAAVFNFNEGQKFVRIVAVYDNLTTGVKVDETQLYGPWVEASEIVNSRNVGDLGTATGGYVTLKRAFTATEVNMYNKMITLGYASEIAANIANVDDYDSQYYIEYFLQFKNERVVNKPEFDGRFFVKVEKDDILRTKVLLENNGVFVAADNYDMSYIDTIFTNPATVTTQSFDDFTWDEPSEFNSQAELDTFNLSQNPFTYFSWFQEKVDSSESSPAYIDSIRSRNNPNWYFYDPASGFDGVGDNEIEEEIDSNEVDQINEWLVNNCDGFGEDTESGAEANAIRTFPGLGRIPGPFDTNYNGELIYPNDGEYNLLTISVNGPQNELNNWATAGYNTIILKSLLQTPGTYFRFASDPNQNVYKILRRIIPALGNIDLNEYNNNIEIGDFNWSVPIGTDRLIARRRNFSNFADSDYKQRETILVPFIRVNKTTGATIQNSGIDVSVWDPRGEVKQNGVGSLNIEFVNLEAEETLGEDSIVTNRAIWETEPKKEVDIDIYYEASNALPITLNTNNIYTFLQPNTNSDLASKVVINKRVLSDGTIQTPGLSDTSNPYVLSIGPGSSDIINVADGAPVAVLEQSNPVIIGTVQSIAIDDEIKFINNNSANTISKVLDHVNLDGTPSTRFDVPGVGDTNQQGNFINIPFNNNISTGMQVTGENVENGTFVLFTQTTAQNPPNTIVFLNKPLIENGFSNFTFINVTGIFRIDRDVWKYFVELKWFNCYSFGNGVESDRIRDNFNAPQIDNGCRVSSTFLEYGKETIGSGMIYSGLYNSTSSVNNLNEFNMAEKITKSLNPIYGSIQAFKTRDTDVVVFTEDKVLKVLSNKDAVFNADGNPQLTATNRVLGQAVPFAGDYGISKNPESLAVDNYRMYFTDKQRGAVLRLSADGLTPISNVGMKTYFREHLRLCDDIIGSFDIVNGEYNVTLDIAQVNQNTDTQPITVSFNEASKGWVSFKSFVPTSGVSVNGMYITSFENSLYRHYSESANRNSFHGKSAVESEIEIIFNDLPGVVKSFRTINYEGSQARINAFATIEEDGVEYQDGEFYNLNAQRGWYVDSFNTDLQQGQVPELIEKENKWFNKINGVESVLLTDIDMSELSVQGIGFPSEMPSPSGLLDGATINIEDTGDTP